LKSRRLSTLVLAILPCAGALPCLAGPETSALCDQAARAAAAQSAVPLDILLAITRAETGRRQDGAFLPWPWAINDNGQGFWFGTEEETLAAAQVRLAAGDENFDIGCFQINTRWHGESFASINDMLDPTTNARYAAQFLTELFQETGDWNQAIAAYHSRTAELATPYLDRVTELRGLTPLPSDQPLLAAAEPQRPNLFPLLQSGAKGAPGSLVPLQSGNGPLFGDRG
jgi:Transglycosylase SLT domain